MLDVYLSVPLALTGLTLYLSMRNDRSIDLLYGHARTPRGLIRWRIGEKLHKVSGCEGKKCVSPWVKTCQGRVSEPLRERFLTWRSHIPKMSGVANGCQGAWKKTRVQRGVRGCLGEGNLYINIKISSLIKNIWQEVRRFAHHSLPFRTLLLSRPTRNVFTTVQLPANTRSPHPELTSMKYR